MFLAKSGEEQDLMIEDIIRDSDQSHSLDQDSIDQLKDKGLSELNGEIS